MPNLAPIPVGTDPSQATAMMNRNFAALNNEQVTKLYNDATGTPSILVGLDSTGNSVIKVAKAGKDVTTAADTDLAFNSAQNTFKVVLTSIATVPAIASPGNSSSVTITHSLGYKPLVFAYVDFGASDVQPLPMAVFNITTGVITTYYAVENLTTTTFKISGYLTGAASGSQAARTVRYYVLQETAS